MFAKVTFLKVSPVQGVDFEERESRYNQFATLIRSNPKIQSEIGAVRTVAELIELSRRIGAPIEHIDIVLQYREMNEEFWPWHGMSKQARRYFVHEGVLPECDPNEEECRDVLGRESEKDNKS